MHYRSNSVLALIPHCKEGEILLQQVRIFQQSLQNRVFLLHVIRPIRWLTRNFRKRKALEIRMEAREGFRQLTENVLGKEIPDNYILRLKEGYPLCTLVNESKKGGYEFIVIDKSADDYPGSLKKHDVDRIISLSACPVLTVNKNVMVREIKKIIIPIDISQRTKKRLYWATYFAKKCHSKIYIVSALNVDISETKSLAYRNAENIKAMLNSRGVDCDVTVLKLQKQKSHKVILNYIREQDPDLVIIRTHQDSGIHKGRIGRFVSEIVHGCDKPVFAVGHSTEHLPPVFE